MDGTIMLCSVHRQGSWGEMGQLLPSKVLEGRNWDEAFSLDNWTWMGYALSRKSK